MQTHAAEKVCSRFLTQEKVTELCKKISTTGESIQSQWPKNLFYQNCGKNYFWIQDTSKEIRMVMHPIKRRFVGQEIGKQKDANNFLLFAAFDKEAKNNPQGAWVEHVWTKPGEEKPKTKLSFVKLCKLPSGNSWIVGSGVWAEDLK